MDRFGTRKGAIFKPVTPSLFKDLGERWEAYEQIYDPKSNLKDEEKWRLIDLCRLVSHASDYEFSSRIGDFIDLDEAARYLAVTVLIADLDGILGPGQNYYLYLNPGNQKFSFISWDQDHSFGQWTRTQEQRENLSLTKPWDKENIFLERLFSVPEFKDSYLSHIKVYNDSLFRPRHMEVEVDYLAEVLHPAIRDDSPENLELFNRLVSMDSHHSYANILPERGPDDPSHLREVLDQIHRQNPSKALWLQERFQLRISWQEDLKALMMDTGRRRKRNPEIMDGLPVYSSLHWILMAMRCFPKPNSSRDSINGTVTGKWRIPKPFQKRILNAVSKLISSIQMADNGSR